MCDRVGPSPLSLLSVLLLGGGYSLAAGLYHKGEGIRNNHGLVPLMVLAFILIGVGTSSMYLSAITTCAKNFGQSKYRGLMLVAPIASFGLGGMVISQIGSRLLYEREADGSKGDVNVFHFFLFLAVLLGAVGILGTFALRIVDEDELIEEAVEELERSGLLEGSEIFHRGRLGRSYGTIDDIDDTVDNLGDETTLDAAANDDGNAQFKKAWLLNAETRRFLADNTMWWFALGFWLIIGPGEAFLNNFGTVIGTLQSPGSNEITSAATHVSIIAVTSTVARLVTGSLSDILSPSPQSPHPQTGIPSSVPSLRRKLSVSRVTLIVTAGLLLSVGTFVLASGFVQGHPERFWVVTGFIGSGYGACFSLMPIITTVIWGIENFGTNFGIIAIFPAIGSTMWGLIYSSVYQYAASNSPSTADGADADVLCHGKLCYSSTFWAMTVSIWIGCVMVLFAWKGPYGWTKRGIVI